MRRLQEDPTFVLRKSISQSAAATTRTQFPVFPDLLPILLTILQTKLSSCFLWKKWASPSFLLSVCLSFVLYFFSFLHSFLLFRSLVLSFFLSFLSLQICIVFPHPEPRNVCAMQRQSACRQTAFCDHIPENLSAAVAARRTPTRASHKKNKKGEEGLFENPLTTRNTWRRCANGMLRWNGWTEQNKRRRNTNENWHFSWPIAKKSGSGGGGGCCDLQKTTSESTHPSQSENGSKKSQLGGEGRSSHFLRTKS